MTILEIQGKLYSWFMLNHIFILEDNFKDVVLISENKDRDTATLLLGLKEFVEMGLLRSIVVKNIEYWVLKKPLNAFNQNVEITPITAQAVAGLVNQFCDETDNDREMCNPCQIAERDIQNLILILQNVLGENEDQDD